MWPEARPPPPATPAGEVSRAEVTALIGALADDSMEGRGTATVGGDRAARFIAGRMLEYGLAAAGDSGYFQRVPLAATIGPDGVRRLALMTGDSGTRVTAFNVVGIVRGSRSRAARTAVLIDAHYDHLGIGAPVNGDSIYNGADDDASGVVAVLAIARALAAGPPPGARSSSPPPPARRSACSARAGISRIRSCRSRGWARTWRSR